MQEQEKEGLSPTPQAEETYDIPEAPPDETAGGMPTVGDFSEPDRSAAPPETTAQENALQAETVTESAEAPLQTEKRKNEPRVALFGNVRVLCFSAMLCAMSVVLAILAKMLFGTGPLRITVENLPLIFAGLAFGPIIGGAVALCTDLCSCLVAGMAPLPLITVATTLIGVLAGLCGMIFRRKREFSTILVTEIIAHVSCNIIFKTIVLADFYSADYAFTELLLARAAIYVGVGIVETYLLWVLFHNKQIRRLLEKLRK